MRDFFNSSPRASAFFSPVNSCPMTALKISKQVSILLLSKPVKSFSLIVIEGEMTLPSNSIVLSSSSTTTFSGLNSSPKIRDAKPDTAVAALAPPASLAIVADVPMQVSLPLESVFCFSLLIRKATSAPCLPLYVCNSSSTRNFRLRLISSRKSSASSLRVNNNSSIT